MIAKQSNKFIKNPIFISYTSLSDFLKCPRAYYFKNIYHDPKTGNRIQIASPYLSLGSTVHDSVKWYLEMGGQVTYEQLEKKFRNFWLKYSGKRGGFSSREEEALFGKRGLKMLANFFKNADKLEKIIHHVDFPKLNLFEEVMLMGNFDFVGETEEGSLHIVDFKTGAKDEKDPIQLYIYAILAEANFGKPVTSASFWYLDRDDEPRQIVLDPLEPKLEWIIEKAGELKKAIQAGAWICIKGDPSAGSGQDELCKECSLHQAVIDGKGEFQFTDHRYKKDVYYLKI